MMPIFTGGDTKAQRRDGMAHAYGDSLSITRQSAPCPTFLPTVAVLTCNDVTFRDIHTLLGF